jgi:hypothetical protein
LFYFCAIGIYQVRLVASPVSGRDEEIVPLSSLQAFISGHMDTNTKSTPLMRQAGTPVGTGDKTAGGARGDSSMNSAETRQVDGNVDSGNAESGWKSKFKMVERSGAAKDKKSRAKELNNCQKRIEMFLEDVVGVSTNSAKHMPVVASDLPFRCLRQLGTIMSDMVAPEGSKGVSMSAVDDLQVFLDSNNSHRRAIKALLTEINNMQSEDLSAGASTGLRHLYLYSTVDDRCDMVAFNQAVLAACVLNISNVPSSPNRSGNAPIKGKGVR